MELTKELSLKKKRPALVALRRKGWYRKTGGTVEEDVEGVFAWLDAILLGEGKKGKKGKLLASVQLAGEEQAAALVKAAAEPEPEELR